MYSKEQVASVIDHAVLKPEFGDKELRENAIMCKEIGVFSMCVKPCDVKAAKKLLEGSDVKVSCVLSFPHGADTSEVKAFQAKNAIENGVDEIDMVMNIGQFLSGNYQYVVNDIKGVVDEAHKYGVLVKVIQETGFLSLELVAIACELCFEAGADFVKTSTGFGPGSASPEVIEVMLKTVGNHMQIKPSGGIRDWVTAVAYLNQGVQRLGVGSTKAVLDGSPTKENY